MNNICQVVGCETKELVWFAAQLGFVVGIFVSIAAYNVLRALVVWAKDRR